MKKKTKRVIRFLEELHLTITNDPQFRKDTRRKSETQIQTEIRPLIIDYLIKYFASLDYKDAVAKANKSFYWEGQEGTLGIKRKLTLGARNYPDFIIQDPYLIAIEYKQSESGSTIKQGIGQSIMHTLSGDFDYVYYLFHDQHNEKRIRDSLLNEKEIEIVKLMWDQFNVFVKVI